MTTNLPYIAFFYLRILALVAATGSQAAYSSEEEQRTDATSATTQVRDADLIIVGAGISGLAAALEAAELGSTVLIVDMASVEGGHAIMAAGGLAIVDSSLQRSLGIVDSPDLALQDMIAWGEDINHQWAQFYVENSRAMVYEWTKGFGVEFTYIHRHPGNSVARFHVPKGLGLGLVAPMIRSAIKHPNILIQLNTQVKSLITDEERVVGVRTTNMRDGESRDFKGLGVMLATGGFQSNLEKVRQHWRSDWIEPEVILAGSGWYSQGEGLDIAAEVNAEFHNLDYMWNYVNGIREPKYPQSNRGLNLTYVPNEPRLDIWLNSQGNRFVNECLSPKYTLPEILKQPQQYHWMVFDAKGKPSITVSGSGWTVDRVEVDILKDPSITKVSQTLEDLASKMELPASDLIAALGRYNNLVERKDDEDFGRFSPGAASPESCSTPRRIDTPPYYAVKRYPLARKSMGGISIDLSGRVLSQHGDVIEGLYAGGEASGLAGINGKAGLEGTFLGPSILTGRVVGRAFSENTRATPPIGGLISNQEFRVSLPAGTEFSPGNSQVECTVCHNIEQLVSVERAGFRHFETVHQSVLEREYTCQFCHGGMSSFNPLTPDSHSIDRHELTYTCQNCHGTNAD